MADAPQQPVAVASLSLRKRILFAGVMIVGAGIVAFGIGEAAVRILMPQQSMHPRWSFSEDYGFMPFKNARMVHQIPGQWRFVYSTNRFGHRGPEWQLSNAYPTTNIVTLGDSYTFGMGVNDGDEYPAVLDKTLSSQFDVINLGVGAWGLTQQIRRFYELGQLFRPKVVVLQFTINDPTDNFNNPVTTVEGGRFSFQPSNSSANWVKKYLSNSFIQKSQLYNLVRQAGYELVQRMSRERNIEAFEQTVADSILPTERYYIDLLDVFVHDLADRGIFTIMISVNGHLERHPRIAHVVTGLHEEGALRYIDVRDWFVGMSDFASPEGHEWGAPAHLVIGVGLADVIRDHVARQGET